MGNAIQWISLANVLMVTTTMRMLNGVHCHTSNNWPAVAFRLVFMVGTTSFQDGFINRPPPAMIPTMARLFEETTFLAPDGSFTRVLLDWIVTNNCSIVSGCTGKGTTISMLLFNVANDGTFRHGSKGRTFPIWRVAFFPQ